MRHKYHIKSYDKIYNHNQPSRIRVWFWIIIFLVLAFMLLPWTQNVQTKGYVTTRFQENRPQQVMSPIGGKITKWYVKEGDFVKKGDTILRLVEVKESYLDPNLVLRTKEQAQAKQGSIGYYEGKARASEIQVQAIEKGQQLKIKSLKNKLQQLKNELAGQQAELRAATNEYNLALDQRNRQQKMYEEGLVSQTQMQQREIQLQNVLAKKTVVENKIAKTQQEIINNEIEQNSAVQEYIEKRQKVEGDRMSALSDANTARADASKLENAVANYTLRNEMYVLTAPQDGQIVQAKRSGIGEVIKDGDMIAMIVPSEFSQIAVEMYVRPVDLPLLEVGQKARFLFDGFPAIVFSGWPEGSYGTFGGKIAAIETTISDNGMFRVIVTEDPDEKKWPYQLKVGSGAQTIVLLKEVPVWYELWRNINGFPPDYYKQSKSEKNALSSKK